MYRLQQHTPMAIGTTTIRMQRNTIMNAFKLSLSCCMQAAAAAEALEMKAQEVKRG